MTDKLMKYACMLLAVVFLAGCKQYVYRPTTIKSTGFIAKNDFEFSVNFGNYAELHSAYAVTDHLAISGTLGYGGNRNDTTLNKDTTGNVVNTNIRNSKPRDNEISLGYFTNAGDNSSFEIFAGMGFAQRKFTNEFTDHLNSANNFERSGIDNRYRRLFIQPAFGRNGKYIDVSIASRFTFITYDLDNHTDFISETAFTTRIGYKNIKFMGQVGVRLYNVDSRYGYLPFYAGFGIYLQFNKAIRESSF